MRKTRRRCAAIVIALCLCLAGPVSAEQGEGETYMLSLMIGDTPVQVEWEQNESVDALMALATERTIEIEMSIYGGFEQVGPIGQSLPREDAQTTTQAGDIVLYSGDQIVVFYGSNSWSYTRLGRIVDRTDEELAALLGSGDVAITIAVSDDAV